MKKLSSTSVFTACFSLLTLFNLAGYGQQPNYPQGKYSNRADSIRKESMAPRHDDSVKKSQNDKMPVIKSDTNHSSMPTAVPEKNQHMPVKELSDTTKK